MCVCVCVYTVYCLGSVCILFVVCVCVYTVTVCDGSIASWYIVDLLCVYVLHMLSYIVLPSSRSKGRPWRACGGRREDSTSHKRGDPTAP